MPAPFPVRVASRLRALLLILPLAGSAANLVSVDRWQLNQSGGGVARVAKDEAAEVVTIRIEQAASPFYLIQLNQPLAGPVAEGDRLRLSFRARSPTGNPVRAVLERTGPPYEAVAEVRGRIAGEWRDYAAETESVQDYAAGGLSARLQCGHQAGSLEFAAIRVENLGPDPEAAAKRAALEPPAVAERIRQIRTGELRIEVRDAHGKPVPDAVVQVEMTRSAFLFGCNIFALAPTNTEPWQLEYQRRFTNLFNYATLGFYWSAFERARGKPDHARLEAMARWCAAHGIATKGHPLVWHETWPKWAPLDPDEAIPLLRARVFDIVPRHAGLIRYWDVLNEANNAADHQNGEGRWIERDGAAAVVATALGWAREASGTNRTTLLYNDFNVGADNVALLRELQARNALPDAIGLQSHMHDHTWPLRRAWQVCESYVPFGRPIHFTELTVVSSTNKPKGYEAKRGEWTTTPEGELNQANYLEKLYALLYSHPSVGAITWWDFSDRNAWRQAPSGLLREDMSPKPAYDVLRALIREKWWTRAGGKTDAAGVFAARAFHGAHRIVATAPDGRRAEAAAQLAPASDGRVVITL